MGPHVLVAEIGRGGMGVVWEARDTRLGRRVALKSLPAEVGRDAAALARLEAEARTLASVSHPNVAIIHGLEESDGARWLVMELIEGPTVRDVLRSGPMTIEEALSLARQVAAGLEAAHERNVVHRDLKPANVKLAPDGMAKILDFGLAQRGGEREAAERGERPGRGAGSPGYMSPEQLRGEPVDVRTDTWALGCLLYECLAGQPAFGGDVSHRLDATLHAEPDWTRLPAALSPRILDLLSACLAKEPAQRTASARQVRTELERALAWRDWSTAADREGATSHSLPESLSPFVGRENEIAEARELTLLSRLVTLTGTGGSGKTRLAIEVARALVPRFPDGCWLVELAALSDPARLPQVVAHALGVQPDAGETPPHALARWLEPRETLLVLDNCEHLRKDAASLVRELLLACPRLKVLATSREPLGVPGEHVCALAPLAVPPESADSSPATLRTFDAVALFVERARAANPSFALTPENAAAVARTCRRLEGLPLAVEIAAARLATLGSADIERAVTDGLSLLDGVGRAAVARHQSLRAALEWSEQLLTPAEQVTFRRMAIFAGGCTPAAARTACCDAALSSDELEAALDGLVTRSFLRVEKRGGQQRLRMLETVREHARERLAAAGEREELERRHAEHFLVEAEKYSVRLKGGDELALRRELETDQDNIRAAFAHSLTDDSLLPLALVAAAGLDRFWRAGLRLPEGRALLTALLARTSPDDLSIPRARALGTLAILQMVQGELEGAETLAREAVRILQLHPVTLYQAALLGVLGELARAGGRLDEALDLHERALVAREQLGDRHGQLSARINRAAVLHELGDHDRSLHELRACLATPGLNTMARATILLNVGVISRRQGRHDEALPAYVEALRIWRELDHRAQCAHCLEDMGQLDVSLITPRMAVVLITIATQARAELKADLTGHDKDELDARLEVLRPLLGDAELDSAVAEGLATSLTRGVELALALAERSEA